MQAAGFLTHGCVTHSTNPRAGLPCPDQRLNRPDAASCAPWGPQRRGTLWGVQGQESNGLSWHSPQGALLGGGRGD